MKRIFLAAIMVFLILSPIGCGHHDSSFPIFTSFIISDLAFDGDISVTADGNITTVTKSPQSVFAGIDSTGKEFRAFLDFPLDSVPGDAGIDSAFLDIFIDSVSLSSGNTIPIRIDLLDKSLTLTASDYDLLPITSLMIDIFTTDIGHHVNVDVTSLMREAQSRRLADFQIRILEDPISVPGIIEIDDATTTTAPQLEVNYF